jgi:hypothetical protein
VCFCIVGLATLASIDHRLTENPEAKHKGVAICLAVRNQYPQYQCYWHPRRWRSITVIICGATDSDRQNEVKAWIADYKTRNGIEIPTRLEFYESEHPDSTGPAGPVLAAFDDV